MNMRDQFHASVALPPGKSPCSRSIGIWAGFRAGLYIPLPGIERLTYEQ